MSFIWAYKLHLYSNLILVGLIWVIQIVHYPSFKFITKDQFLEFNSFHQRRITFIVAPTMLLELLSAIAMAFLFETTERNFMAYIFLMITSSIWLITFIFFIPLHQRLLSGTKELNLISKLVQMNWLRTFLWTLKAILLVSNPLI